MYLCMLLIDKGILIYNLFVELCSQQLSSTNSNLQLGTYKKSPFHSPTVQERTLILPDGIEHM